jgi:signal transduction histidine kinase/CheY-like chemotaxis protein
MPRSISLSQPISLWSALKAVAIFTAFVAASELAFTYSVFPAVFPVHSGVALAALVLAGAQFWPAIFFGALFSYWLHDTPAFLALSFALANAIQAVTATYILRYVAFRASLRRMRDIFWLTIVALLTSTIVPVIGFFAYEGYGYLGGTAIPIPVGAWWVGHLFSLLIVSPFLIRWLAHPLFDRTWKEVVEIIAAMTILLSVYVFLFFTTIEQINGVPLVYAIFPPLFWIALRLGSRFMTLSLFATSTLALIGTTMGRASISTLPLGDQLFLTQIFLEVMAVIFLTVTAVEEERRTATARLQGHIDQLQEALTKIRSEDQAKTQFVATLAHELRNPLAPLLSTIELLTLRGPDAKDFPSMLGTMRDRVRTMARLLDDLLDISRISHQKLKLQKSTVDIVGIVKSSVESMSGYMQKRNLSFNVTLPQTETLLLEADPIRLEQIIVNLLHNAAKYTDIGGTIHLLVERDRNMVAVRVRDTGIGIPPNMLQRIFEPFLQVNAKNGSGGLGIGLSLTKRLVELHDGSIEARSDGENKGSEFVVRLPLLTVSPIQPALPRQDEVRVESAPTGLRILLVDDNQAATETLGKLLEFKGHAVRFAHDGRSTLKAAEEFDPHVIMLDIGLPDMSGYDVARLLRQERGHDFALVAITGYGQDDDKSRAKTAGFDHHLTKPVGIAELEKTLALLAESRPRLGTF